jgi:hypothetical protein
MREIAVVAETEQVRSTTFRRSIDYRSVYVLNRRRDKVRWSKLLRPML